MKACRVRALELEPALLESWEALGDRALEQNPFFEPACVLAAARHLPEGDRIEVLLAVEERTVYGCMPLRSVPKWHWSRRGTVTTNVRRLTWLGTPLLDRERADEAMTAMLTFLRDRRRRAGDHLLAIEWMHAKGPVADVLARAADRVHLTQGTGEEFERPVFLQLPSGGADGSPDPVRRPQTIRKKRRRLVNQAGIVELVDRSGDPSAVRELIALESRGYKSGQQIALRSWPGEPEWFEAMCAAFAAQGRIVVTSVVAGGQPLAIMVTVAAGSEAFLCITAFDEAFSAFSPGLQLHYDTIDHLAQAHYKRIDTCTYAGNETESAIFPDRLNIATVLVGLGSPVESTLLRALPIARRLRARLRYAGG